MTNKDYHHLSKAERDEISILLAKGYGRREIARAMGRFHGTISREIRRNKILQRERYTSADAQHKAYVRRKYAKAYGRRIHGNRKLENYIVRCMKRGWSPVVISGRMQLDGESFYASKTAIYDWLYSDLGQKWCEYLSSKRYRRRKRRHKKTRRTLIPNRVGIESRPVEITERLVYGHGESDTIVSGKKHKSTASLAVVYERKARYIDARKIVSLKPARFNEAVSAMCTQVSLLSLTLDNGIENVKHEELKSSLHIETYFCDPYSSWQKGGVENANRMIRRFIPKGSNIADFSEEYISAIVHFLNSIPRKILNFKTPYEVMQEQNLLKYIPSPTVTYPISGALRG